MVCAKVPGSGSYLAECLGVCNTANTFANAVTGASDDDKKDLDVAKCTAVNAQLTATPALSS